MKYNHTLVRYENRKIYCALTRSYMTNKKLLNIINSGLYNLKVLDHKTKTDITAKTLLRALYLQLNKSVHAEHTGLIIRAIRRLA